jgi:hypothetical protein
MEGPRPPRNPSGPALGCPSTKCLNCLGAASAWTPAPRHGPCGASFTLGPAPIRPSKSRQPADGCWRIGYPRKMFPCIRRRGQVEATVKRGCFK